jgi:hypothetical protein
VNPLSVILDILQIASAAAASALTGDAAKGNTIASALIQIAQKANLAHQQQVGAPIDPTLLRPFEPLE